jgi:hypothetical protein
MKKSELQEMIREVVKEETKNAVVEALVELFSPKNQPNKVQVKQPSITKQIPKQHVKQVQTEQKTFSKDPILNAILNETANSTESRARMSAMSSGVASVGEGIDLSALSNIGAVTVPNTETTNDEISYDQLDEGVQFSIGNLPDMPSFSTISNQNSDIVSDPISKAAEIFKRSLEKSKSKRI